MNHSYSFIISQNKTYKKSDSETMDTVNRVFAIIGKFGVAGTFGVIYVHASELYPTPVRSIGKFFSIIDTKMRTYVS